MHVALWVLAATSLIGAFVCLMRPGRGAEAAHLSDGELLGYEGPALERAG